MIITGTGYAVLRVTSEQIRELHRIPKDVEFLCTLETNRTAWNSTLPTGWYHDEAPFYFRIQHRYLPRTPDRGPLIIFTLGELLRQYEDMKLYEERQ
jgi:hypothetical protein